MVQFQKKKLNRNHGEPSGAGASLGGPSLDVLENTSERLGTGIQNRCRVWPHTQERTRVSSTSHPHSLNPGPSPHLAAVHSSLSRYEGQGPPTSGTAPGPGEALAPSVAPASLPGGSPHSQIPLPSQTALLPAALPSPSQGPRELPIQRSEWSSSGRPAVDGQPIFPTAHFRAGIVLHLCFFLTSPTCSTEAELTHGNWYGLWVLEASAGHWGSIWGKATGCRPFIMNLPTFSLYTNGSP